MERLKRARGFALTDDPEGRAESETFTCAHCSRIVVVPHRAAPDATGGICYQCYALVCPACAKKGVCTPFMKRLEAYEKRDAMFRSLGI